MDEAERARWRRVDAMFAAVLEQPPDSRRAWLAEATAGDPDLRREVEALLTSIDRAEAAIGDSAEALVGRDLADVGEMALEPDSRVGAYRVLRELGRGGMGTVYLARRDDAEFERAVAIKVVSSLDSWSLGLRFARERRILGSLEHPRIARLYDSGITERGLPYLVMEFVAGTRIDRFVTDRALTTADRLRLFLRVCDAVAFAHGRMVVHRDLKAANILVTDDGEVKLLDFGIARLLGADRDGEMTAPLNRVLTPEYAAPEQFAGAPSAATMDQYALGVLLHELLTGRRPSWQVHVAGQAPPGVIEAAFEPPSTGVSNPALRRQIRGDLDVIVTTALALDPGRRYPSIEAMADDVRRHLAGHPIRARAASPAVRATKFIRRHPIGVAVAATAAIATVAFVGVTVAQARRIERERDRAEAARVRSTEVARLLTGLFESADPFAPVDPDSMRVSEYLAAGVARVDRDLSGQPATQAELLAVLGGVYRGLGRVEAAEPLLERSVNLRRTGAATSPVDLAESLRQLGRARLDQGRHHDADSLFAEAVAHLEATGSVPPSTLAGAWADWALALTELSRFDSAGALFDRALGALETAASPDTTLLIKVLNDRGYLASRMGDNTVALDRSRQAYELNRVTKGPDHPTTLVILSNLAFQLDLAGQWKEAIPRYRETVAGLRRRLGTDHPNVGGALRNLSAALTRAGQHDEAIDLAIEASALDRRRLGGRHLGLAITLDYLAGAYEGAGRHAEALPALAEGYRLHRELAGPDAPETAIALARWAGARCRPSLPSETRNSAIPDFRTALRVLDLALPEPHPQRLARHIWYGVCLAAVGRPTEAGAELEAQLELAIRHHRAGDQIVQIAIRELRRHYDRTGSTAGRARVDALADSLGVPAR